MWVLKLLRYVDSILFESKLITNPECLNDLRGLDITNQLRISPTTTDQAFPWKFHATDGKSTAAQGTCVCFAFHRLLWCIDSILPQAQNNYKVIRQSVYFLHEHLCYDSPLIIFLLMLLYVARCSSSGVASFLCFTKYYIAISQTLSDLFQYVFIFWTYLGWY